MAENSKIWVGRGVLRPGPDTKERKALRPGDEVTKGFVSSTRLKQLEKNGKVCSAAAYAKGRAVAGEKPSPSASVKIKELEAEVKELTEAGAELAVEVKELTEANKRLAEDNKKLTDAAKGAK